MSKDLALIPSKEEFEIISMIMKTAEESRHFEKIGKFPGLMSIALYAREVGISPMIALHGGFQNVMGKVTMSAELMNSLIRQKGLKLEILESTDKACRIKGTRKDTAETYTASFSIEDARRAGLIKNGGGYDKHTDDMLFARCISKLKRRLFPDVACKAYVEGELEEVEVLKEESKIVEIQVNQKNGEVRNNCISIEQSEEIESVIGGDQEYLEKILAHYKADSLTDVAADQYELILKRAMQRRSFFEAKQEEI